ncbi:MAG: hypothetical protein ACOC3G_04355, partial [Phycisphaeraceae bacterium]
MRRWIRRLRLAVASLLVLLAVGLLLAWPVTMRHACCISLQAGPEWERWWSFSGATQQGWQTMNLYISDEDQHMFSVS